MEAGRTKFAWTSIGTNVNRATTEGGKDERFLNSQVGHSQGTHQWPMRDLHTWTANREAMSLEEGQPQISWINLKKPVLSRSGGAQKAVPEEKKCPCLWKETTVGDTVTSNRHSECSCKPQETHRYENLAGKDVSAWEKKMFPSYGGVLQTDKNMRPTSLYMVLNEWFPMTMTKM